jgi:hypothetical protein
MLILERVNPPPEGGFDALLESQSLRASRLEPVASYGESKRLAPSSKVATTKVLSTPSSSSYLFQTF